VVAVLSSPLAAKHWPSVFYYFGFAGVAWCGAALFYLRDAPRTRDGVSSAEVDYIEKSLAAHHYDASMRKTEQSLPPLPTSLGSLLATKHFAAIYVSHFCTNWSVYIIISWVPTYLTSLGASIESVGAFAVLPYVCYWVVDVSWGQCVKPLPFFSHLVGNLSPLY
jgi:ACS family sodium-dependent inorganic phosphate cotransporter